MIVTARAERAPGVAMKLAAGAGASHVRSRQKPIGSCGDKRYHAFDLIDPIANAQISGRRG
jgi:hypothetical protein